MDNSPNLFEPLIVGERKRWDKRRRLSGWLTAVFGLLGLITLWAVIVSTRNARWDVPLLISTTGLMVLMVVGGTGFATGQGWSRVVLWPIAVVFLFLFPLGTVLGGYTLWVLYNTRGQATPRRSLVIGLSIWAVFVALLIVSSSASPPTPFERQLLAAIEAQGGTREFQQWVSAYPTDTDEATAHILLARQGLVRLGTDDQFARLRLLVDGLGRTSGPVCATFARGGGNRTQALALIEGLDSTGLRQFSEVSARAILAQLRNSPPPTPASETDISEYVSFLYESLPQTDRRRLEVALESPVTASDADACWSVLLWYRRALEPHPSRARWLRVVTTLNARSGQ